MSYLIDTCCISGLIRKKPDLDVVQWFSEVDERNLFLSVITLGELEKGVQKLPDSQKKQELTRWINNDLIERFNNRIIPVSMIEVKEWGRILAQAERKGASLPVIDALIAATAIAHNLTVVTRNIKDMERSGVDLLNPWKYK